MSEEITDKEEDWVELEKQRAADLKAVLSFLVGIVILVLAGLLSFALIASKAKPKKEEVVTSLPSVEVIAVESYEGQAEIAGEGIVATLREVTVSPEISGKIIEVGENVKMGGQVRAGELLVRIDRADYQNALDQALAQIADAEMAIIQEEARRDQALRDWETLGSGEPSDLLSRKPQLKAAEARLAGIRTEVARAQRNLERTEIRAPFDGTIRSELVERGMNVTPNMELMTLFSPSELEVMLPVALSNYGMLSRDELGNLTGKAILTGDLGGETLTWPGQIARGSGEIASGALTAGVVVAIQASEREGPLRFPPPGLFVQATLMGNDLAGTVVIPREAVRGSDEVFVVNDGGTIERRQLTIVRSNRDEILASKGVEPGERLITTRMNSAVDGMEVVVAGAEPEPVAGE